MTVLFADPPWKFGDNLPGPKRGAAKHYRCMSISDLELFRLPRLGADCALILWKVAAMPVEAMRVCSAWGFVPKSEIVWVKTKNDGTGLRIGMGRTVRNCHETAIVATRGKPGRLSAAQPSVVFAPRAEHSAKPDAVYELVERLYPGPYIELFARTPRLGWEQYGDELFREVGT